MDLHVLVEGGALLSLKNSLLREARSGWWSSVVAMTQTKPILAEVHTRNPSKELEPTQPKQDGTAPYMFQLFSHPQEYGNLKNGIPHLVQMSIPCCMLSDLPACNRLETATTLPPVTRATLSELDLNWIMHNVSLRVDVNYDHDLHFMPIKGPCGEQKRKDAREYWLALAAELEICQHDLKACPECLPSAQHTRRPFKQRLPAMFEALRELLETLVPDRDHPHIADQLDIPFLMQQVRNGVLDIVRLSAWVAELLKSHCAPMRDEWADNMAKKIEEGAVTSNMDQLAQGLEKLFSFLEAMKLVGPLASQFVYHVNHRSGRCKPPNSNVPLSTHRRHCLIPTSAFPSEDSGTQDQTGIVTAMVLPGSKRA